jgi:hypothetical protein
MLRKGTQCPCPPKWQYPVVFGAAIRRRSQGLRARNPWQGNVRHIGSTRIGSGTIVIHCTLRYLYNNNCWINVSLRRALRSCHERQKPEGGGSGGRGGLTSFLHLGGVLLGLYRSKSRGPLCCSPCVNTGNESPRRKNSQEEEHGARRGDGEGSAAERRGSTTPLSLPRMNRKWRKAQAPWRRPSSPPAHGPRSAQRALQPQVPHQEPVTNAPPPASPR